MGDEGGGQKRQLRALWNGRQARQSTATTPELTDVYVTGVRVRRKTKVRVIDLPRPTAFGRNNLIYYFLQLLLVVALCAGCENFTKDPRLQGACICGKIIFYFIMHAHANPIILNLFLQLLLVVALCAGCEIFTKDPCLQGACICGKIIFYFIMRAHANTIVLNHFLQLLPNVA
jgi:hypothetical protein